MLGGIGATELIIILIIVLVIFGASRLPQIGEGLGKAISNFKKSVAQRDDKEGRIDDKTEKKQ